MNALLLVTILAAACLTCQAARTAGPCVSTPDRCTCEKADGSVVDLHRLNTPKFGILDPKGKYKYLYSPCGNLSLTNCSGDVACQTNSLMVEDFALGTPDSDSFEMNGEDLAIKYTAGKRTMLVTLKCNQTVNDTLSYDDDKNGVYNFTLVSPAACATAESTSTATSTPTSTSTTQTTTTPTTVTSTSMTTSMKTNATTTPSQTTSTPKSSNMTTMPSTTSSNSTKPSTTGTASSPSTASTAPKTMSTMSTKSTTSTMSTPTTTQGASAASSMALVTMVSLAVLVRKLS